MSIKSPTAYEAQLLNQVAGFESFLVPMCQCIVTLDKENSALRNQLLANGIRPNPRPGKIDEASATRDSKEVTIATNLITPKGLNPDARLDAQGTGDSIAQVEREV